MFSPQFVQLKWENHHPPPKFFLELLRIVPSILRSAFSADSKPVSAKSESERLTPPAGLKSFSRWCARPMTYPKNGQISIWCEYRNVGTTLQPALRLLAFHISSGRSKSDNYVLLQILICSLRATMFSNFVPITAVHKAKGHILSS